MPAPKCTDDEFIELFRKQGPHKTSKFLGAEIRGVYARRARLERRLGIEILAPGKLEITTAPPRVLLLDIETAPHKVYAWGLWDQNIGLNQIEEPGYTLCWAAKWFRDTRIMFSSLPKDGKKKMLDRIHALLEEADVIVHYNGTKFDLPTLQQEFLAEGMDPPASALQIDLLQTVRRKFRLPSNKLDYVARHLSIEGKLENKGMELWRDCMNGVRSAWRDMQEYNQRDVTLLEQVYEVLIPWISNHPNHALFSEDIHRMCPKCGSRDLIKQGHHYTTTQKYQRFQCKSCGGWCRERGTAIDAEKRKNVLASL